MSVHLPAAIEAVWERNRGQTLERIDVVEEAVGAMLEDDLDESLRARAERDAHKLAGSLGMFGFSRGSELARHLEQALAESAPAEGHRLAELVRALRAEIESRPASHGARHRA